MIDQEKLVTKIRKAIDSVRESSYNALTQDESGEGFIQGLEHTLSLVTETALESAPVCESKDCDELQDYNAKIGRFVGCCYNCLPF